MNDAYNYNQDAQSSKIENLDREGTQINLIQNEDDLEPTIDEELKTYEFRFGLEGRRYLILILTMVVLFLNQFAFINIYINSQEDKLGGTPYMPSIFYVLLFTTSTQMIDRYGHYKAMLFSITMQLFGMLLAQVGGAFALLAGLILNGIAMPLLYNMFMSISSSWFNMQERVFASGLMIFSMSLGFSSAQWSFQYNYASRKDSYFQDATLGLGIANLAALIACAFIFQNSPEACPSRSQTIYRRVDYDFMRDLRLLKQDSIFRRVFPAMVILVVYSYFSPFTSALHYRRKIDPRSDDEVVNDILYPLVHLAGILASTTILAFIMSFKKIFLLTLWANVISLIVIEIGLLDSSNVIFYIGYLGQAFFTGTIQILIYEFTTEICFPVSPTIGIALLHLIAMPIVLLLTAVSFEINRRNPFTTEVNAVFDFTMAFIVSSVAMFFWQIPYRLKRIEFDHNDGVARS